MEVDKMEKVPRWTSCRYAMSIMGFFGTMCMYILRINFSVAIVCMTYDEQDNDTEHVNRSASDPGYIGSLRSVIYGSSDSDEYCPNNGTNGEETGEFPWDRELRGILSSSFFWGYVLTQFPGGWLAQTFGGKHVVTAGMSISIVMSFLSPPAARLSPYALAAVRFINGLGQGVFYPAYYMMAGRWFPMSERSFLMAVFSTGSNLGSVLGFAVSGFLCATIGWPWIFYVYSILSVVLVIGWILFAHDTPALHPRISQAERKFIEDQLETRDKHKPPAIPWRGLLLSPVVWGLAVTDFCARWGFVAGLTQMPQYMQDVLEFDITENGVYSALPKLTRFFMLFVFSLIGDSIVNHKVMKVLSLRRLMSSIALLIPMLCVIGVGYLDCNTAAIAIVLLVLQEAFNAAAISGYTLTRIDIAPQFSGILMGITNTSGNIAGVLTPMAIGFITKDGTHEQWQLSFMISALMYLVAWISFMVFAKSDVQDWAKTDDACSTVALEVDEERDNSEKTLPSTKSLSTEDIWNPQHEITHM